MFEFISRFFDKYKMDLTHKKLIREYNELLDTYEILGIIAKVNSREHVILKKERDNTPFKKFKPGILNRLFRKTPIIDIITKKTLEELRKTHTPRQKRTAMIIILRYYQSLPRSNYELKDFILSNASSYDIDIRHTGEENAPIRILQGLLFNRMKEIRNTPV